MRSLWFPPSRISQTLHLVCVGLKWLLYLVPGGKIFLFKRVVVDLGMLMNGNITSSAYVQFLGSENVL